MAEMDGAPLGKNARWWLMGGLVTVVAPQLFRMPVLLTLFCSALLVYWLLHELKGFALPGRVMRLLLVVVGVSLVVFSHHTLLGQPAGAALLAVMLCLKPLELRQPRDGMVIVVLGYFLLISSFLLDQSMLAGLYILLAVIVQTAALVALHHPAGSRRDTVHYMQRAAALVGQAIPIMIVLFIFFPRLPGALWSLPDEGQSAVVGLGNDMSIGDITDLVESERVAFRVEFDGEAPAAGDLYWRGPVLWETDGRRWFALPQHELLQDDQVIQLEGRGEPVRYSVVIEPQPQNRLFALDLPALAPEKSVLTADFQLLTAERVTSKRRYEAASFLDYTRASASLEPLEYALQLPADVNPRARALGRLWREQGLDAEAIVGAALDYFREQPFYYSRQPPRLDADPVDQFLFTTRTGFCEHYAAAFATIARAADVPARIVLGYQGAEASQVDNYYIVRQSRAHAWVEVFLDDQGWVRVDPTAVIPPERIQEPIDRGRFGSGMERARPGWLNQSQLFVRHAWDALNYHWTLSVMGYGDARQRNLLKSLGLEEWGWRALVLLLGLSVAAALAVAALLLMRRRNRTLEPAVRAYHTLERKLTRHGLPRQPHEGPLDYRQRAMAALPDKARELADVFKLYTDIRYGRRTAPGALTQLKRKTRALKL